LKYWSHHLKIQRIHHQQLSEKNDFTNEMFRQNGKLASVFENPVIFSWALTPEMGMGGL
jgi:hypothetical protein